VWSSIPDVCLAVAFREKIDTLVRFPLEGLNLAPYIRGGGISCTSSEQDNMAEPIYDLYAVSNHFGGSGFGHYTAYSLSPGARDWYLFDDSSVSKVLSTYLLHAVLIQFIVVECFLLCHVTSHRSLRVRSPTGCSQSRSSI
jgi:hypothetical protein